MHNSITQKEGGAAVEPETTLPAKVAPEKIARTPERAAPLASCDCPPGCVGLPCCA